MLKLFVVTVCVLRFGMWVQKKPVFHFDFLTISVKDNSSLRIVDWQICKSFKILLFLYAFSST